MEIDLPQIAATDQEIYSAAPAFFRLKDVGYLEPSEAVDDDERALCRELGVSPREQKRHYPIFHYWGIETPPGWHKIVLAAVTEIEAAINDMLAAGRPVEEMVAAMQIKEKFGWLRISYRIYDGAPRGGSIIEAIVSDAEKQTRGTCSICGAPGKTYPSLGMSPFCPPCTSERSITHRAEE